LVLILPAHAAASQSSVRSVTLTPADLPGFLLDLEGPAHDVLIENPYPFLSEVREQTIVDNWQRLLVRPDYLRTVSVQLIQFRNRTTAMVLTSPHGSPDATPPPLPPGSVATVGEDSRHYAERAAVFYVGPVFARIETIAFGHDAGRHAELLLSRAAAIQAKRIGHRPQAPGTSIESDDLKRQMDLAMFFSLLLVIALVTLVTWLRDPSARRRMRLRWSGRPSPPAHALDVDARATRLIRRHAIEASVRIGLLFCFVGTALFLRIDAIETALLITAGLALWGWLENSDLLPARRFGNRNPRLFRGWALAGGAVGTLGAIALIGAGAMLVWLGTLTELFGVSELEPQNVEKARTVQLIAGVALIFASALPLRLARRLAMRQAHRQIERDGRDPVLLLRAFSDDGIKLRARRTRRTSMFDRIALRRWDRLEEILAAQLNGIGPVEAIGEPGSQLPPLGAARRSYPGETWRTAVQESIGNAAFIVVDLGRTRSLAWEIAQIRDRGALGRTIFVLPPVTLVERRARLHALAEVLDVPTEHLDCELPGLEILAVLVPDRLWPRVITSSARDDVSYELAVEAGVETLRAFATGERWPLPTVAATRSLPLGGALWHEPGKAPRPKRWYRRYWAWVGLLAVGLPVATSLLTTESPALTDFDVTMPLAGAPRLLLSVPGTDRIIAVEERNGSGVTLEEVDLDTQRRHRFGATRALLSEGVPGEGWVVLSSARDDVVTAFQVHGGRHWEVELDGTPRGVAIEDGAAFVALTAANELVKLSLTDGRELRRIPLGPGPWGVAKRNDDLLVTLAGGEEIATINPRGLMVKGRYAAVRAPRAIDTSGPGNWVLSASEGALELLADGHTVTAGKSESALSVMAANSHYTAISTGDGSDFSLFDRRSGAAVEQLHFKFPVRSAAITDSNDVVITFIDVPGLGVVSRPG
jgi:hypothetical protein